MDFTPPEIITINWALETNVKEEAKERMVAVHASPAKFPEQAKSSAARLRALVRILQSREETPPGSPGPEEPGPFATSVSQVGRRPPWELRMIEYAERAYSRAMKLAEVLVGKPERKPSRSSRYVTDVGAKCVPVTKIRSDMSVSNSPSILGPPRQDILNPRLT